MILHAHFISRYDDNEAHNSLSFDFFFFALFNCILKTARQKMDLKFELLLYTHTKRKKKHQ